VFTLVAAQHWSFLVVDEWFMETDRTLQKRSYPT
jgi:hypothetical protein